MKNNCQAMLPAMPSTACAIACEACDLWTICRSSRPPVTRGAGRRDRRAGFAWQIPAAAYLFRAGRPARAVYGVRQGTLKTVRISPDGDERVVAFHLPGDVVGLDALSTGRHSGDVIALEPSALCELPLTRLHGWSAEMPELARSMLQLLSSAITEAWNRPELTRGAVWQRVEGFIGDLSARLEKRGLDGRHLWLSMSRADIASFLDLRIETISRTLRRLRDSDRIDVRGRRLVLQ
ncbi:MAG: cyclic nucleotide-binding domain-containing protein [Gammaproteobacteria bacterium]|nr:cyclic nucleotide-binding domain-containing protein [Gammaproteobacteria bacterium]